MKIRSLLYLFSTIIMLSAGSQRLSAQELNCEVEVNADQVQGTNTSIFETLQEAIKEYMNNTRFTNAQFSPVEKINCRLFFTIKDYTNDMLSGDLQVQSTRPVYNSSYTTTLLNFKDNKIEFRYQEHEPLRFTENTMESNLTAILNYYAYLILALDFDSFSPLGGQPYYDRLSSIVQLAQTSGETGWKAFEDNRNRSAVLEAYTGPSTSGMRDLLYQYHRQGLDQMSIAPDKGRASITAAITTVLPKIAEADPMSVGLSMFRDAKLDELVNIYSKGSQDERDKVYEVLHNLYPTEESRLRDIKNPPQKR